MEFDDCSSDGINGSSYVSVIHAPIARRRTYLDTVDGRVTRFYVQLEYNCQTSPGVSDDWVAIALFDHQPENEQGHDISNEGLHMDIRHPVEADRKTTDFPSVSVNQAPGFCENYFDQNYRSICHRFEKWRSDNPKKLLNLLSLP